ncbi:MAG: hypothetical protein MI750_16615 [Xanthomonadales bacterium]|nr:hypothetical protein [Xanthomonadales bacterium]
MEINKMMISEIAFIRDNDGQTHGLSFDAGINVVYGPSDTGKTYLLETIDYLLGAKSLREIPERSGYKAAFIKFSSREDKQWAFERNFNGGKCDFYSEEVGFDAVKSKLNVKHVDGKVNNISGHMLNEIGLLGKYLIKNREGETQSFSFRDLLKLVLINEKQIIRDDSPFLSNQYVAKTASLSALKLILTGVDDEKSAQRDKDEENKVIILAKINLLEEMIHIENGKGKYRDFNKSVIISDLNFLDKKIEAKRASVAALQSRVSDFLSSRRSALNQRESILDRQAEINSLLERFLLLQEHYAVDLNRLKAIEEAGSLFIHYERVSCPLCGSLPNDERYGDGCDEDIRAIVMASNVESKKIMKLSHDLSFTIDKLNNENELLKLKFSKVNRFFDEMDKKVKAISSQELAKAQEEYIMLLDRKNELSISLIAYEKLVDLERKKSKLQHIYDTKYENKDSVSVAVPTHAVNELCKIVKNILDSWDFPDTGEVHYDESKNDFVINGKLRGIRGQGLKAVTHAAASIGLLEYCQQKGLAHPGFLVLDSALLAYYKPEGKEDDLRGTDLKSRFYHYLIKHHSKNQIILIENEQPPLEFQKHLNIVQFTKNPNEGRYGLLPHNS